MTNPPSGQNSEPVNPPAVEKYIHFQLDQMSVRNEHHRFEEICFRVARRRVSSNVKLASGPVSAGGDQGRDVESYVTWLPEQLPRAKGFVASATDKPVVVACTLQKENLASKVRGDVTKICEPARDGTDDPVEYVLFCCVASVPASKQHELQAWARNAFGVRLEFFDGLILSRMVAEFDLVWVAQEYLDLPSNMVPDYPGEEPAPQWYRELLSRCRKGGVGTRSLGDLAQIRPGLRHATYDDQARGDLPDWLGFMSSFIAPESGASDGVMARARYEIAVAHIRGLESLAAVEPAIRDFLRYALTSASVSLLEDAQVLLMFYGAAMSHGLDRDRRTVTATEIVGLHSELTGTVTALRAATDASTHPVRHARLLTLEAMLALHPDYRQVTGDAGAATDHAAVSRGDGEPGPNGHEDFEPPPPDWLVDADRAVTLLGDLVDVLPMVPAFPVESVARRFDLLVPTLVDIAGYEKVRDGLDEAVQRLEGDAAAAHRSRDRAMTFFKNNRPFDALRELHVAKEKWWHGDTLQGALLAMRMIARIYASLGMTLAAKQYRLSAASLAVTSDDDNLHDMAAEAFIEGVDSAYQQGMWLDVAGLARVAVLARGALLADPFDYDQHAETLKVLDFDSATTVHAARAFWPGLEHVLMTAFGTTGWETRLLELVDMTAQAWGDRTEEEFLASADRDLAGTPFGDAGPTRTITFAALGTRWFVEVANEQLAVLAAERMCAATQILLCELYGHDPLLVPQDVHVKVRIGKPLGTQQRVHVGPSNIGLECKVFLTPYSDSLDHDCLDHETFTILAHMLFAMSMRSSDEVMAIIEETAKNGLLVKLTGGRSYDEAASLLDAEHYQACRAAQIADRATPFAPVEVPELAAPTGPGPGYDHAVALDAVASRYENVSDLYWITLGRVVADERVHRLLEGLRADGWLDWHLIAAVAAIATNYRANRLGYYRNGIDRAAVGVLFHSKETAESLVVPLDAFDEESFAMTLRVNASTVATGFGLTPPTQTPNLDATLDLLRGRYGYFTDDVAHLDLLAPEMLDESGHGRQMILAPE